MAHLVVAATVEAVVILEAAAGAMEAAVAAMVAAHEVVAALGVVLAAIEAVALVAAAEVVEGRLMSSVSMDRYMKTRSSRPSCSATLTTAASILTSMMTSQLKQVVMESQIHSWNSMLRSWASE